MPTTKPTIPKEFARQIAKSVLNSLIEDGTIDPRGKTESQIFRELAFVVRETELAFVVDHTKDWLRKARAANSDGDAQFSIICYATWAEHMLNKMVSLLCSRHKVGDAARQAVIRHTGTAEKFIWLSLALSSKAPPAAQINRLRRVSEARNQYLHYKWKPDPEKGDRTLEELTREGERLISTIRHFLNKHFYRGHRRRMQSIMKRRQA
jgi:hypothetical protein